MATYKVIQDIEAEDKLLGPLTFRQFVYAGICAAFLFLTWFVGSRGGMFLIPVLLPPALVAGFFAFPWGRDQPTELWALAKIRFMLKPRKRTWDQSGAKELVTITAPKHAQTVFTDNLTQTQVKSRLRALADTIDSRGWVVKGTGAFPQPALATQAASDSDRLVAPAQQQPTAEDSAAAEDMFDEQNNPRAQRLNGLIDASSKARRQKVMDAMNQPQNPQPAKSPADYWFLNQPTAAPNTPGNMVTFSTQVVTPKATQQTTPAAPAAAEPANEEDLVEELEQHKQESPMKSYYGHMKKILPLSEQQRAAAEAKKKAAEQQQAAKPRQPTTPPTPPPPTPQQQAAIRQLAGNNDLNVATIAREAKRSSGEMKDEVVIKLH